MNKVAVSKHDVFRVCNELSANKHVITRKIIREKLGGRGSFSTIAKYYTMWQEELKVVYNEQERDIDQVEIDNKTDPFPQEQFEELERLSAEVFIANEKIIDLEKNITNLKEKNKADLKKIQTLEEINSNMISSYNELFEKFVNFEQQQSKQMLEDLQAINLATQDKVHEIAMRSQDVWLNEKVKLKEQLTLNANLAEQNKILEEKLARLENAVVPLKNQLAYKEKIIQKYVSFEQLKAEECTQ